MTFSLPAGRPGVQPQSTDAADHRRQIAQAVNRINQGHFNATLFVTLDPSATSTTVTDSRISEQTAALFMPQTAHAAAALSGLYVSCTDGSMTVSHASSSQADRTFTVAVIG